MESSAQPVVWLGRHRSLWQGAICLFLLCLLIYNPFVALHSSPTNGFSYTHLARNRSTVGASELQHFSPVRSENAELDAAPAVPSEFVPVCVEEKTSRPVGEAELPLQPDVFVRIWFRPPPAR